jgi:hypothetical protein
MGREAEPVGKLAHDLLRAHPHFAQFANARSECPLLEPRSPVIRHHERNVRIPRWTSTESACEPYLPRSRRHEICAPKNVSDAHRQVIDDHRELVGKSAVASFQNEIADVAIQPL